MKTRSAIPAFLVLLATLPFGGCKTTDTEGVDVPPAANILFVPRVRRAVIQSGEGRYPNLFTTASYAVWGPVAGEPAPITALENEGDSADAAMESKPESVPVPADVEAARAGGLTVECHLESEFPDRSIAYDAVGLRGMTIYLELPDGTQLQPAQKTLDSNLVEVPVGALRRYGRKLTLYFSDSQFMVENPAANPAASGVRLVMNGLDSQYFFEWPATPNFLAPMEPSVGQKVVATTRAHLRATRETVSRVSHTMD